MKLFLTGITGYIGSEIAKIFRSEGYEVLGLVRSEEQANFIRGRGYQAIIGDLKDKQALLAGVSQADGVIHTAISLTPQCEELDVGSVATMLDGLEGSGKPFIYTSGTLIYNDTREQIVNEESSLDPMVFLKWKVRQEEAVVQAAERTIRTIIIRPSLVYGHGGGLVKGSIQLTEHLQAAKYIDKGDNAWSTIHVEDLARLFYLAFQLAAPGSLFNATSREMVTMKQLTGAISRLTGLQEKVESWTLEEAAHFLGPAAWAGSINQRLSGLKAEQQLNWQASSRSILQDIEFGSYRSQKH
ncbi:NAD-dependent epimerase/dehydratase family protein [Paenibacillus oryzisoli]|uniref:Nucleoside-diphosphate sugar epimerase n=1 Tax=Paenibacillus oryzisoli TaxID=1850517 RepID=A0A198ARA1_9BACL|nr:NAD-dependent epimerase/dehydratase family protein [Paenibacillus oryzisoli]OAS23620.1 nucleoside-diphosphate sugar epimerase [Paenibacillus oryzisoli]